MNFDLNSSSNCGRAPTGKDSGDVRRALISAVFGLFLIALGIPTQAQSEAGSSQKMSMDLVTTGGHWEGPIRFVASFSNPDVTTIHLKIPKGYVFKPDIHYTREQRCPYQCMIIREDVIVDIPSGENIEQALSLVCTQPDLIHPARNPDLNYRIGYYPEKWERALEVLKTQDIWAGLVESGALETVKQNPGMADGILQWAVWAQANSTVEDLTLTVRTHVIDDREALVATAAIARDVGTVLQSVDENLSNKWFTEAKAMDIRPGEQISHSTLLTLETRLLKWAWPTIEVTHIKFDHKGGDKETSDALNIRWDYKKKKDLKHIGNGKGKGEWIKNPPRNEPALYVKKKKVTIKVRFKVKNGNIVSASIKAKSKGNRLRAVKKKLVNFDPNTGVSIGAGGSEYVEMEFEGMTGDKIEKVEDSYDWIVTEINGVPRNEWVFDVSGPHTIYTVLDVPKSPWYDNAKQHPWVDALDFVIDRAGTNNKRNPEQAAKTITQYVFSGHKLTYNLVTGMGSYASGTHGTGPVTFNLTSFIPGKGFVNCYDVGAGVTIMTNLVTGKKSKFMFMKLFGYLKTTKLVGISYRLNNPFHKHLLFGGTPAMAGPDDNRHLPHPNQRLPFDSHGVMELERKIYDSCVGPQLGTDNRSNYIRKVVDKSTALERIDGATTGDFKERGPIKLK